jgi:predicted DNA-binding transcriptional regulator AlpA
MTKLLRFRELKERGIIPNWPTLRARINRDGFPRGRMIGPNARAWTEDEVDAWIASRPTAGPPPRGAALRPRGRPRKLAATA